MSKFQSTKILLIILVLSISILAQAHMLAGDPTILPRIGEGTQPPQIDGNLTATEWQDSVIFNTTISGYDAQIRVLSDASNLYIGFNYTSSSFVPVNNTSYNESVNINPQSHDWVALQIDNNLDQKNYATETSPDDIMVVDQLNSSLNYDGFLNGSTSGFFMDTNSSGTQDGTAIRANSSSSLSYEFKKSHKSTDKNGFDFNLNQRIFQFRLSVFFNETSNTSLSNAISTEWFALRINETGTGLAIKSVSNTTIAVNIIDAEPSEFLGLETTLNLFGFNATIYRDNFTIDKTADLNIFVLGNKAKLGSERLEQINDYMKLGGKMMIFLSNEAAPLSSDISESLGVKYLPNSVLTTKDGNATSELTINNFGDDLVFLNNHTIATDSMVNNVTLSSAALNITDTMNKTANPYVLYQDFIRYDLFKSDGLFYDSNDNSIIDDNEVNNGLSLGVAFDLMEGGRISLFPSTSLIANDYLTKSDNMIMLLRMIPWNARLVNTLEIHSTSISSHVVNKGDMVDVSVNVTDEQGNAVSVTVNAYLYQATGIRDSAQLSSSGTMFTGKLNVSKNGAYIIKTVAKLNGYGFAKGEDQNLFANSIINLKNDLSYINWFLAAVFAISIVMVILIIIKVKSVKLD